MERSFDSSRRSDSSPRPRSPRFVDAVAAAAVAVALAVAVDAAAAAVAAAAVFFSCGCTALSTVPPCLDSGSKAASPPATAKRQTSLYYTAQLVSR